MLGEKESQAEKTALAAVPFGGDSLENMQVKPETGRPTGTP